jgi:ubiquinol-cytochrome c reductase cytochrome b subunit
MKKNLRSTYNLIFSYKAPINLSYMWNFGSIAIYALAIQIITGFLLALWYVPHIDYAFNSVEYVMREVQYGWLIRYLHSNGASLFFFAVYVHMAKAVYYGSYTYPREWVWYSGFVMFMLMIITAFFGYVLPWGQMSYWAATVITSLISTIPVVGGDILTFIWGGITVDQPTLTRIYGLHFILPFVIVGFLVVHLILLHEHGSNNPLGVISLDNISFHPYYTYKDFLGVYVINIPFLLIVFFYPNVLSHPDNYIPANPEVTPLHIVPEWYFLPFYGILRSVPSKAGGIILLILAILCLALFPLISKPIIRSGSFRPIFQSLFWIFVCDCFILGWSGGNPVEPPYYVICQVATVFYFVFFVLNYFLIKLETKILVRPLGKRHIESENSEMDLKKFNDFWTK